MNIGIGIVHAGNITFETANTLALMGYFQGKKGHEFTVIGVESCLVDDNANKVISQAQKLGFDYLMFLDADIELQAPGDIIGYMMEFDKDVVAGVYYQGLYPHRPVLYSFTEDIQIENYKYVPTGLTQVDAAGAGFILIKKKVLDLFTPENDELMGKPFDPVMNGKQVQLRADAAFFWRLKQLGVELWAQPMIPLVHIKKTKITPSFFEASREYIESQNEKPAPNNG